MYTVYDKFKEILKTNLPINPTLVLDIDDTIINTSNGSVNIDVLNTYKIAKKNNINVFIITARKDFPFNVNYTYNQMEEIGIINTRIFFMPLNDNNVVSYKHNIRKLITDMGYNIIASIGDKFWDLGSYCMYNFYIYPEGGTPP